MSAFEDAVEAAKDSTGVHRWKDMGVDWCSCECGEVLRADEATAILESFPADEVFREHIARHALTAALPVLLDGLDREALAGVIQEAFPTGGGGYSLVWEDCFPAADAVIARLRDEFGVTT